MVRVKDLEFSVKEFSGALGDFGPINPFIVSYIAILGLNPVGVFLAMGVVNIALGFIYRLPLPVEPKKAIATAAIAERWRPQQVYLAGFVTGIVWLILSLSGIVNILASLTPITVIRGIQFGLAIILLREAVDFMLSNLPLALICIALIALLSYKFEVIPSALAVFSLGLIIALLSSSDLRSITIGLSAPDIYLPSISDFTYRLATVAFSQIILTFSNAILATCLAVNERFPKRRLREEKLALNMGALNIFSSIVGGVPMCHGSGGFASQYFFGARTGGSMIMEGVFEVVLALMLADPMVKIFRNFPSAVVGAMLFFACIELCKPLLNLAKSDRLGLILVIVIGVVSSIWDLALGYMVGLAIFYLSRYIASRLK